MSSSNVNRGTRAGRAYLDLQAKARREGRATDELLQLYALEGFLERLASSRAVENLVLKGGVLLAAYDARRPTRDIDLSGQNFSNDTSAVLEMVRMVLAQANDDGWEYGTSTAEVIRPEEKYSGVRVNVICTLAAARMSFDVDVSVGDPVWPSPEKVDVPRLLGGHITVPGYPLSMVYAEKLVTAIQRGTANTRWRDFADVYLLSSRHETSSNELAKSIALVSKHRQAAMEPLSKALEGFAKVAATKWAAWVRKQRLGERVPSLEKVLEMISEFADPVITGTVSDCRWHPVTRSWEAS